MDRRGDDPSDSDRTAASPSGASAATPRNVREPAPGAISVARRNAILRATAASLLAMYVVPLTYVHWVRQDVGPLDVPVAHNFALLSTAAGLCLFVLALTWGVIGAAPAIMRIPLATTSAALIWHKILTLRSVDALGVLLDGGLDDAPTAFLRAATPIVLPLILWRLAGWRLVWSAVPASIPSRSDRRLGLARMALLCFSYFAPYLVVFASHGAIRDVEQFAEITAACLAWILSPLLMAALLSPGSTAFQILKGSLLATLIATVSPMVALLLLATMTLVRVAGYRWVWIERQEAA